MNNFSKLGFILATLGSSIGLGHIWRFPYMTGENGGGAFVLFYLLLAVCIGVSMLMAEMLLGNKARSNPLDNFVVLDRLNKQPPHADEREHNTIAPGDNKSLMWLGLNAIAGPLILSFYAVVMGWIVYYLLFVSFDLPQDIAEAKGRFGEIAAKSLWLQLACFAAVIALTAWIVAKGIKKGIEVLNLILMPLLFVIFIGLLFYAMSLEEFGKAWAFMFSFEPSKITSQTILDSLGQVFFSLSLGAGTIAAYAASAQHNENLFKSSLWVVVSGIIVSLIAGLMIFTFIYHYNGEPSSGPGLLLESLPLAFNGLGGAGSVISMLFFIAVLFAGITSTISMLEPGVSILRDKCGFSQVKASYVLSGAIFALGSLVILWSNADFALPKILGKNLFDVLDIITSSFLMPVGMLITLLFIGYRIKRGHLRYYMPYVNDGLFTLWYWIVRLIAPCVIVVILLTKVSDVNLAMWIESLWTMF